MDEVLKLFGNFGFPIVVSANILARIEEKPNNLSESIMELAKVIAVLKVRGDKIYELEKNSDSSYSKLNHRKSR